MNIMLLSKLFDSAMGPVDSAVLMNALKLMLFGMVSIFIVIVLIYLVIYILNKATGKKKEAPEKK